MVELNQWTWRDLRNTRRLVVKRLTQPVIHGVTQNKPPALPAALGRLNLQLEERNVSKPVLKIKKIKSMHSAPSWMLPEGRRRPVDGVSAGHRPAHRPDRRGVRHIIDVTSEEDEQSGEGAAPRRGGFWD